MTKANKIWTDENGNTHSVKKATDLSRPLGSRWVRTTFLVDGSRSWTYHKLQRDAINFKNQIGGTRWDR